MIYHPDASSETYPDFLADAQRYFPTVSNLAAFCFLGLTLVQTVYSQKCRSWYKMGKEEGRIVGLWPGPAVLLFQYPDVRYLNFLLGSCLHALRALRYPRWEDFNYEPIDAEAEGDGMFWLGNGMTLNEQNMSGDSTWSMVLHSFLDSLILLPTGAWYLDEKWIDPPPSK